jgi:hypothetical protein
MVFLNIEKSPLLNPLKKVVILIFFLSVSQFTFAQTSGTLDATFGTNGKVITSLSSGNDIPSCVVIQNDGKIIVAGAAFYYSSNSNNDSNYIELVRYLG